MAGEFRDTTKTRKGREVPIIAPLAADLLDLRAQVSEGATASVDPEVLVCASGRGTRSHTYISLQIHAGEVSPVTVAA